MDASLFCRPFVDLDALVDFAVGFPTEIVLVVVDVDAEVVAVHLQMSPCVVEGFVGRTFAGDDVGSSSLECCCRSMML